MRSDGGPVTAEEILEYLDAHPEAPRRPRRLATRLGVSASDYPAFRALFKQLRREGRLARGADRHPTLVGRFRAKEQGFGFVRPEGSEGTEPREDVFVPAGRTGGAMTGDLVVVRVGRRQRREGRRAGIEGEVLRILERGITRAVGTVSEVGGAWFLEPDGRRLTAPVLLDGVPPGELEPGAKVVAEIVEYPQGPGLLPVGAVTEVLGPQGELAVETEAVIRAWELPVEFSDEALAEAKRALEAFEARGDELEPGRIDRTDLTVVTIDPTDARDFDDAISLTDVDGDVVELGVHIADVASFVPEGGPLDRDARARGTSVYFPRRVLPMLPPSLSAGACALKAERRRLAISVFIRYDRDGEVRGRRFEATVIASSQRLTYAEAQAICDGKAEGATPEVTALLRRMAELALTIRARRLRRDMLSLSLPEVALDLDAAGKVIDAKPAPQELTHTVIEMFMVEANEAVASALAAAGAPVLRRVHPEPTPDDWDRLRTFAWIRGHRMPRGGPDRRAAQRLVEAAQDSPERVAIHLAVLRAMQRAHYALDPVGHFALASDDYCHFTSPIRRYPDLVVHRMVRRVLLGGERIALDDDALAALDELADHCSATERRAEAAELELRLVLVLQLLATRVGETFRGVVTGIAAQGLFVQMPRFLVEGMVPRERLGGGWWDADAEAGMLIERETGTTYRLGDTIDVEIEAVDVALRHLDLRLASPGRERRPQGRRRTGPRDRQRRAGSRNRRPRR